MAQVPPNDSLGSFQQGSVDAGFGEGLGQQPTYPGYQHQGFDRESYSGFLVRTVPRLIIVDRGRVTSHNTEFEACLVDEDEDEIEVCQLTETAEVAIVDLDDEYRVKRIEFFKTDEEKLTHDGGLEEFYAKVEKAKSEAAKVVLPK
ncbi:hypothetical protein CMUS01_10087 [Colletotrichum musicola]|uniref:Uncharacterized protein n=1 Tax=Colletotrichum musicola TaxID=2175873 RepID=A0A8H6K4Q1_9PEZI|nr:hypothetical protein CMUS01_10087 [Colletotrichum musicola]